MIENKVVVVAGLSIALIVFFYLLNCRGGKSNGKLKSVYQKCPTGYNLSTTSEVARFGGQVHFGEQGNMIITGLENNSRQITTGNALTPRGNFSFTLPFDTTDGVVLTTSPPFTGTVNITYCKK